MTHDYRSTHPAAIGKAHLWFGPEVEGHHFCGAHTAFVAKALTQAETAFLQDNVVGLKQIFLTETFRDEADWAWLASISLWIKFANIAVTISVMENEADAMFRFRDRLRVERGMWINMMVRVFDAPWALQLKQLDQVSVGVPYHMLTFRPKDGVLTKPDEYERDAAAPARKEKP